MPKKPDDLPEPDAPGEFELPPRIPPHEMQRMHRAMQNILAKQDFESEDEMREFMQTHFAGRKIDDIIAEDDSEEDDAEFEAMELAAQAARSTSVPEARRLCKRALELDPWCVQALQVQALLQSTSQENYTKRLGALIKKLEKHYGDAFMRETTGHFWGVVETRPYMNLRMEYILELLDDGKVTQAIKECEKSLRLNPGDNQGVRYLLIRLYLEKNKLGSFRKLLHDYADTSLATFGWANVLERVLSGKLEEAEALARECHKNNPHTYAYLTGEKVPGYEPGYIELGGESEAIECFDALGEAWEARAAAFEWLQNLNPDQAPNR